MPSRLFDFTATRSIFSNRNFALFTAGNTVSLIGTWVQRLAQGWLVWEMTGSGTWLGAIAVAEFLPTIIITPITGTLSDRFDRRTLSVIGQSLACLQAIVLCTVTALGLATPQIIFMLAAFGGIVYPLVQTARLALVPSLIDRKDMTAAVAVTAIVFNVSRIVGPAVAGFVIAEFDVATAFGVNAVSYLFVIFALLALNIEKQPPHPANRPGMMADIVDGWQYTLSHRALGPLMGLWAIVCTLSLPLQHLLPGIIDTFYGGGPKLLAAFTATMGAAAVLAGLWMVQRSGNRGLTVITLIATLATGAATAAFAANHMQSLAYILIGVLGFLGAAIGTTSQTLVQTSVNDAYRGRALSVWYTAITGGQALGALVLGAAAERFGFGPPLIVGGFITVFWALVLLPKRHRFAALLEKH